MTPLGYAEQTLERLLAGWSAQLPTQSWAQVGRPIVTCEAVAVGTGSSRRRALFANGMRCGHLELTELVIAVARECTFESDESGHTDVEAAREMSKIFETDTAILDAFLNSIGTDIDASAETIVQWVREGAFIVTIATTTVVVL